MLVIEARGALPHVELGAGAGFPDAVLPLLGAAVVFALLFPTVATLVGERGGDEDEDER